MIFKDWINERLAALGKKWSDLTKAGIGGQTSYNIQHGKYKSLKNDTLQKIALVLECCIGDVKIAIAESLREEAQNAVAVEPVQEPEPLPFDDEPEPEPDGKDLEWLPENNLDNMKPKKVKVKPDVISVDVPVPEKKQEAMAKVHEAENLLDEAAEALEVPLSRKAVEALKDMTNIAAPPRFDNVNHPAHYTQGGIECIEAIKASMTALEYRGFLKGNAMKYMWRYQHKGGVEDLKKARWYLDRLIKDIEAINMQVKDRFGDFDHLKPM